METGNINDYLESIDRNIESGAALPKRDISGQRIFNEPESHYLNSRENQIKKKADNYQAIDEQLKCVKERAESRLENLKKRQKEFLAQKEGHKDTILKCKKKIEQLCETIDYYNNLKDMGNGGLEMATNKKKRTKKNDNLFGNILLIIIVEAVVSAATWMIQREALPLESIIIRIGFLVSIGAASVYQLHLYQKTSNKVFKTFHNITLILGFICILDGLFIGFFMSDTAASTTLSFDLTDQVNVEQLDSSKSLTLTLFKKFPGIAELLITIGLLFASKIVGSESLKHEITSVETNQWSSINLKIASAKTKISKQNRMIEDECHKISLCEASDSAYIEESLQECAKFKKDIEDLVEKMSSVKNEINKDIIEETNELAHFRTLYLEILSLKPNTTSVFMPKYEVATENDVRQYYRQHHSINI